MDHRHIDAKRLAFGGDGSRKLGQVCLGGTIHAREWRWHESSGTACEYNASTLPGLGRQGVAICRSFVFQAANEVRSHGHGGRSIAVGNGQVHASGSCIEESCLHESCEEQQQ